MGKLAALILSVLAVVLMGAGPVNGQMKIQLSSTTPGVVFDGDTLVCPTLMIEASSGRQAPCEIKIESIGDIPPGSVIVSITASGLTSAEIAAKKFAIVGQNGPVYLEPSAQIAFSFSGLTATLAPVVVWGGNAGALDDTDLGAAIVVTYTVVASSEAAPSPSPSPSASSSASSLASPRVSPSLMPDTTTGPTSPGSDGLAFILFGLLLVAGSLFYLASRRRDSPRPK